MMVTVVILSSLTERVVCGGSHSDLVFINRLCVSDVAEQVGVG